MRGVLLVALAVVSLAGQACTDGDPPDDAVGSSNDDAVGGELLVSAAASLTDAFEELAERFEQENPGVEVALNLDSSATLAKQITSGAPVDVFASADQPNMAEVVEAGEAAGEPVEFARNHLVIVTAPDNPFGIEDEADLPEVAGAGEVIALCAATAPCGELADRALGRAGVVLGEGLVTRAANARATLGAVTRGDAAAALVYSTDALAVGEAVASVELDGRQGSTSYMVAALDGGNARLDLAARFAAFITSDVGRGVLDRWGFQ